MYPFTFQYATATLTAPIASLVAIGVLSVAVAYWKVKGYT